MKSKFAILLTVSALLCGGLSGHALTGSWRGELSLGAAKLPLVFNFKEDAAGKTTATMDSPQQNAKGIPVEVVYCSSDSVNVACRMIGASYAGKIAGGKISGIFEQQGYKFPLALEPEVSLQERRPQTPVAPFPYETKDTTFRSSDGTELAGTLTIPEKSFAKKLPMVVMVTGSGPQNRDEEVFEHRPFAVIADYLARNGIASFRYDDRGVAKSKGNYQTATIYTFREDAVAALRFVRSLEGFGKVGILGHSEGGSLAVVVAPDEKPDFIVSLAGATVPLKETLIAQNEHVLDRQGVTGKEKEQTLGLVRGIFEEIERQYEAGEFKPLDIEAICKRHSLDVPAAIKESIGSGMARRTRYFDSQVCLDPTPYLKKVKCPVLAINGTKDTQVDAEKNLKAFSDNIRNAEIHRMEGLNHLLQHASTGESSEYGELTETISPDVLRLIADFIRSRTR